MRNPFPKLTAETKRHPDNVRPLEELGAYLTSVVLHKPRDKNYDFYEFIGTKTKEDETETQNSE